MTFLSSLVVAAIGVVWGILIRDLGGFRFRRMDEKHPDYGVCPKCGTRNWHGVPNLCRFHQVENLSHTGAKNDYSI